MANDDRSNPVVEKAIIAARNIPTYPTPEIMAVWAPLSIDVRGSTVVCKAD